MLVMMPEINVISNILVYRSVLVIVEKTCAYASYISWGWPKGLAIHELCKFTSVWDNHL